MRLRVTLLAAGLSVAVFALVLAIAHSGSHRTSRGGPVGAGHATGGVRYVSPNGSDHGAGTLAHPWRTVRKALRRARPGMTIVLEPGIYGARGHRLNWTASGRRGKPITIRGVSRTHRAVILGYNKVVGSHLRLANLSFLGPTGPVDPRNSSNPSGEEVMVWLYGSDDEIQGSEVAGSLWHAGIYVTGSGERLVGDYIHDNGDFGDPAQAKLDHGIYWGEGAGGLIADNLIVHNLADGIQIYPDAHRVTVAMNTIVDNGNAGVIIAGASSDNLVVNNIVAYNAGNSIRSDELSGSGNVVENNLVWRNGTGNFGQQSAGLKLLHAIRRNPRFVSASDFSLQPGSPAVGRAWKVPPRILYDIEGIPRGQRPDLGAYQGR